MKPILFNTEMVKAILDGRKTQTRRVFSKTQIKYFDYAQKLGEMNSLDDLHKNDFSYILQFSKFKVDDLLWVREPAKVIEINDYQDCFTFKYLADNKEETLSYLDKWENKDGMTVPRWVENCQGVPNGCIKEMARIFLKVTNVRVERLQNISDEDCLKDGIENVTNYNPIELHRKFDTFRFNGCCYNSAKYAFKNIWNSTAKDGYKWEDNPYVFVYKFERIKK